MFLEIILFLFGLISLLFGGKLLISGSGNLARTFQVPSLIIGLTIVSFGTSAPEIAVSLVAAWKGEGGLAVGNILGSNIFNILLVLGFSASFTPLIVKKQLVWWDVPIMILSTLLFWLLIFNNSISRLEGAILFAGIIIYLVFAVFMLKRDPLIEEKPLQKHSVWLQMIWILLGLVLLGIGSQSMVDNATKIARFFGVSELLIGLTIVAIGTSLPELVTTFIAMRKGENDIAVGNVIGSNIFNLLAVMGLAGLLSPEPIEVPQKAYTFDLPILLGISIATLPIFLTGHLISRWEGFLFLFYYLLYLTFLLLESRFAHYLPYFTTAFLFFILPLTILTLSIGLIRHFKKR